LRGGGTGRPRLALCAECVEKLLVVDIPVLVGVDKVAKDFELVVGGGRRPIVGRVERLETSLEVLAPTLVDFRDPGTGPRGRYA